MSDAFTLDPRLEADSIPLLDMRLSTVRLMNDVRFSWLLMVPRKAGLSEIIDLDVEERALLMEEISLACRALKAVTGCDKLNVGALGNVVRQLHVHVVARFEGDAAWDGPV
ncbi:HIT family protein [Breoghania sp.]|uniref:HIT family protein n=1 Tax=Breoghania sp. TaxID=2065378 RepID=UPI00260B0296|nr:HIT family protein [Breoghania sp.]MDJ0933629.1 HIT family protein [Breoghania sp.]